MGGDVNKDGGRDDAFLKVVAGMLGVEFSDLRNRYQLEKIEEERIEREKKEKLQIAQSRFVAEKAKKLIDDGDSYMARKILYEVLPNQSNPDRPLVQEAEGALRKACSIESAILRGHTKAVWSLSFAGEDRIVSTGWGGPSFFWEVNSGYGKVIENSNRRQTACFSPDGSRFLVVGNEVTIYDSATLNRIDSLPVEYPSSATYSPDGKNIFVSTDKLITIFDANTF